MRQSASRETLWWVVLPLVLLAAAAAACGPQAQRPGQPEPGAPGAAPGQPKYGGTFRFYIRADPPGGFEPHIPGGRRDPRRLIGFTNEYTVTRDNEKGQQCGSVLTPSLAEQWRFVDDTTVELAVRKGVKFHNKPPVNGREMTAEDVVWSYQRLFDRGDLKGVAKNVASMEAADRYTVRIKLKERMPLIAALWWTYRAAPVIAREAGGPQEDFSAPETLIGTGPFMLDSYTPGVKAVFKRNPAYWKEGLPYLDGVEMPIMRDDATRLAALRTGQLDYLDEVTIGEKNQLAGSNLNLQWIACEGGAPFRIYMKYTEPPFNNVDVRRAMSMAVDRAAIVKSIYKGEGNVIVFGGHATYGALKPQDLPPQTRKYLEYNPEEAKRLLAKAGYANGIKFELEGTMGYGSPYNELLELLPSMLKTAGFDVTLKPVELAQHQSTHTQGKYDMVMITKGGFQGAIEDNLADHHSRERTSSNRGHVKDPEYDRIVEQMLDTLDEKKRIELAKQAQVRIVDQALFVPIPAFFNYNAFQPWVKGQVKLNETMLRFHPADIIQGAWLDK